MRTRNLPFLFFLVGVALKGLGVAAWHLWQPDRLDEVLVRFDPLAVWLGDTVTALVFDQRPIAPSEAEIWSFEVLLVLGFGLEFLLLGFVVRLALRRFQKRESGRLTM